MPHTCKETPFHYFDESLYQMVSGYRRHLLIPKDWQGKRILLTFEGAAHDSTVFCNGKKVGEHHCGYTAFTVDLTDNVLYGQDNLLCVRLDSREEFKRSAFWLCDRLYDLWRYLPGCPVGSKGKSLPFGYLRPYSDRFQIVSRDSADHL